MGFVVPPGIVGRPGAVKQLEKDARTMLRLVSPRISATQDEKSVFAHCRICNPPPEVFTCVVCGFATEAKWQYSMHIRTQTGPCARMAEKKAKAWARQV